MSLLASAYAQQDRYIKMITDKFGKYDDVLTNIRYMHKAATDYWKKDSAHKDQAYDAFCSAAKSCITHSARKERHDQSQVMNMCASEIVKFTINLCDIHLAELFPDMTSFDVENGRKEICTSNIAQSMSNVDLFLSSTKSLLGRENIAAETFQGMANDTRHYVVSTGKRFNEEKTKALPSYHNTCIAPVMESIVMFARNMSYYNMIGKKPPELLIDVRNHSATQYNRHLKRHHPELSVA